jgi:hypothetical protein
MTQPKLTTLITLLLLVPAIVDAQGYNTLVNIPGVTGADLTFASYINVLYNLAIVAAALIAVIQIVLAGAKYMMTDVVSGKSQATSDIRGALIGLLIILSSWVILNTINPDLKNIRLAQGLQDVPVHYNATVNVTGGEERTLITEIIGEISCFGEAEGNANPGCNETACQGVWVNDGSVAGCQGYTEYGYLSNVNSTPHSQDVALGITVPSDSCGDITCDFITTYLNENFPGYTNNTSAWTDQELFGVSTSELRNGFIPFSLNLGVNFDDTAIMFCSSEGNQSFIVTLANGNSYYSCLSS